MTTYHCKAKSVLQVSIDIIKKFQALKVILNFPIELMYQINNTIESNEEWPYDTYLAFNKRKNLGAALHLIKKKLYFLYGYGKGIMNLDAI